MGRVASVSSFSPMIKHSFCFQLWSTYFDTKQDCATYMQFTWRSKQPGECVSLRQLTCMLVFCVYLMAGGTVRLYRTLIIIQDVEPISIYKIPLVNVAATLPSFHMGLRLHEPVKWCPPDQPPGSHHSGHHLCSWKRVGLRENAQH